MSHQIFAHLLLNGFVRVFSQEIAGIVAVKLKSTGQASIWAEGNLIHVSGECPCSCLLATIRIWSTLPASSVRVAEERLQSERPATPDPVLSAAAWLCMHRNQDPVGQDSRTQC